MRLILSLFIISAITWSTSGCKKGCDLPKEDENLGVIVNDAIIYPKVGFMTDYFPNGVHLDGSSVYPYYSDKVEVSLNGGPRQPFTNISGTYHILAYRTNVKCDVSFVREVLIDHLNQIVTYNITIKECDKGCDEIRGVENYVLVPAFPSSYTLVCNVL